MSAPHAAGCTCADCHPRGAGAPTFERHRQIPNVTVTARSATIGPGDGQQDGARVCVHLHFEGVLELAMFSTHMSPDDARALAALLAEAAGKAEQLPTRRVDRFGMPISDAAGGSS